jgi:hypothetical protein
MTPEKQHRQNTQKKPYAEPRLQVYGDIRAITQTSSTGMGMDGASGPNHKTG